MITGAVTDSYFDGVIVEFVNNQYTIVTFREVGGNYHNPLPMVNYYWFSEWYE